MEGQAYDHKDPVDLVLENRMSAAQAALTKEQKDLVDWAARVYSTAVGRELEGLFRGTAKKLLHTTSSIWDRIRQQARTRNVKLPQLNTAPG